MKIPKFLPLEINTCNKIIKLEESPKMLYQKLTLFELEEIKNNDNKSKEENEYFFN